MTTNNATEFVPVVTMPEPEIDTFIRVVGYTADQLRAYAASVARAMVPDVASDFAVNAEAKQRIAAFNACRQSTLDRIDAWEKNNG